VSLPRVGTLASRNELLGSFPGATGVKTGFTAVSGYSVIGSALRNGRELVAVVLDTPTSDARFDDAAVLLEHGFAAFEPAQVQVRARLRVAGAWVPTQATVPPVLVPRGRPDVDVEIRLPIEPGGIGMVRRSDAGCGIAPTRRCARGPRCRERGRGAGRP
jgi:D-alanyl-D-alanine carboxypeptidase